MYRFTNDYSEGAHPSILEAMTATNLEGNFGYGCDPHCEHAAALIRQKIGRPDADVHFFVGGTQTNATCICAFLRPHEAAIAAHSGHICVHETGAVEATGHKCIAMPAAPGGKLTPELVRQAVAAHPDEHMVKPRLVYVSNTTEVGGVYTTAELEALRAVCDELGLLLYLDGARLASALACGGASFEDLGRLCDAFYIGGTKNGAIFGEAVCIMNPALKPDFRYILKQHGGMLAKGWLLGVQFEQLMRSGLYEELGEHSTRMAQQLAEGLKGLGVEFLFESPSNQIFPILPDEVLAKLEGAFHWEVNATLEGGRSCIRLVCSWATQQAAVTAFLLAVEQALKDCPACM
ncbi:threonine aldolase family protein [Candidatus Allofournierella excrementavium]|uniref:threonine aldolase family protein n=1 Tax=Candidatus Allofournierella excrementavium TaxID=2838591 RepID=UPI00374F653E